METKDWVRLQSAGKDTARWVGKRCECSPEPVPTRPGSQPYQSIFWGSGVKVNPGSESWPGLEICFRISFLLVLGQDWLE